MNAGCKDKRLKASLRATAQLRTYSDWREALRRISCEYPGAGADLQDVELLDAAFQHTRETCGFELLHLLWEAVEPEIRSWEKHKRQLKKGAKGFQHLLRDKDQVWLEDDVQSPEALGTDDHTIVRGRKNRTEDARLVRMYHRLRQPKGKRSV